MRVIVLFSLLTFMTGCTATYHPVAQNKLISQPPDIVNPESAVTIIVKRDKSFAGGALDARFYFDGEHIVTLSRAETFTFRASPGKHTIEVKSLQPISMIPVPFSRDLQIDLESGGNYEYIFKAIPMSGIKIVAAE